MSKVKLLHGENLLESREALVSQIEQAKVKGEEVVSLDGQTLTLGEARAALESGSLFGQNRLVVVENLFSGPKSKEKTKIIRYLNEGKFDNNLVIWEPKQVETLPFWVEPQLFRLAPLIFRFLESLGGRKEESLRILDEVKRKEGAEIVFHMLVRQIRLLLLAKDLGVSGLSELSGWQQKRILAQTQRFSLEELKSLYRHCLEIDFQQKTSQAPFGLSSSLDLLVSEI